MLPFHFWKVRLYHRVGKGENGAVTLRFVDLDEIVGRSESHWLRLPVSLVFQCCREKSFVCVLPPGDVGGLLIVAWGFWTVHYQFRADRSQTLLASAVE